MAYGVNGIGLVGEGHDANIDCNGDLKTNVPVRPVSREVPLFGPRPAHVEVRRERPVVDPRDLHRLQPCHSLEELGVERLLFVFAG